MTSIFQVLYRFYRLFSVLRHWAQRRFTPAGLVVLGGFLLALVMSPDTDNNVGYQALSVLFFLLLVALLSAIGFRMRFSAERKLPRFGTVGCPLTYSVTVRNQTGRTQSGLTLLENQGDVIPSFQEWLTVQLATEKHLRSFRFSQARRISPFRIAKIKDGTVPVLPPKQEREVRIELTPFRRGLLRLEGLTIARPDPLGLFRAFRRLRQPESMLILPRRYPLPPIPLPGTMKYQQGGVAQASHVGQSEEFVSLRDYRNGDPLRHIHWRTWARAGKPVVKEFEDEFFVRHALVLDTFAREMLPEVFEEAVAVAASFACSVQSQESLLDLLFVGTESFCFTTGRGLAHSDQMLEILAAVQPCRDRSFRSLQELVLNHCSELSGCICVLLAWDKERRELVHKLKLLRIPTLVLLVMPAGKLPRLDRGPIQDEPQNLHVLQAGRIQEGLAALGA